MSKNLLFVLLAWCAQFATAQTLGGVVLDNQHQAISYVTVRLLNIDSTFVQGAHTDSVGRYAIELNRKEIIC